MTERDRPSRHGAIFGEALADMAAAGREVNPTIPEECATCAFRRGCMTNQMGGTGILALNCAINVDPDDFACHHGMKEGWPTKLCAGYLAATHAPFEVVRDILERTKQRLDAMEGPDCIREEFDAWWATVDPERKLDNYELGRRWLRYKAQEKESP